MPHRAWILEDKNDRVHSAGRLIQDDRVSHQAEGETVTPGNAICSLSASIVLQFRFLLAFSTLEIRKHRGSCECILFFISQPSIDGAANFVKPDKCFNVPPHTYLIEEFYDFAFI
jgi:hypothetical protein